MIVSHILRFWHSLPFVRLLLPLILGIAVADKYNWLYQLPIAYTLSGLALLWLIMLTGVKNSWDRRALYGIISFIFFFVLGLHVCSIHWQRQMVNWPDKAYVYEGQLTEGATTKKNSILFPIKITTLKDGDTCRKINTNILLYLPKEEKTSMLKVGDTIRFYGQIKSPENFTPTFDYVRYLQHQHITGTLYTKQWSSTSANHYGWKAKALHYRKKLLDYYQCTGIKKDELAVLSALTLGYKKELSEDISQLYSISGASHVLALSGLHIGILCLIVTRFWGILLRSRNKTQWRQLLSLPVIWGFVALVGFPVSAIRAATMFSFLVVGNCLTRVGFSLNTLALTAFCMLLYNPFYMFDVGFQMSFAAVASLLILQPWMKNLIPRPSNAILRYLWGITTVSVSAQIGVTPLIIYYFSRISIYALVVNLWVVPLTFVIIGLTIPFLLIGPFPISHLHTAIGWILSALTSSMNQGLTYFNGLPGADISGIELSIGEMVCMYATIFFFFYGVIHKRQRAIIGVLGCMCVGIFIRILL